MKVSTQVISIVGLVSASSAFALDVDFNKVDVDGNGAISVEEAAKYPELMNQFTQLDGDQNGELSESEFAKAQ